MATVHVEIPPNGGVQLLEMDRATTGAIDEQNLKMNFGPFPGLPNVTVITFTASGEGHDVHVEIPLDKDVTQFEVPTDAGLPVVDEDDLTSLLGVPGTVLVLLKIAA